MRLRARLRRLAGRYVPTALGAIHERDLDGRHPLARLLELAEAATLAQGRDLELREAGSATAAGSPDLPGQLAVPGPPPRFALAGIPLDERLVPDLIAWIGQRHPPGGRLERLEWLPAPGVLLRIRADARP